MTSDGRQWVCGKGGHELDRGEQCPEACTRCELAGWSGEHIEVLIAGHASLLFIVYSNQDGRRRKRLSAHRVTVQNGFTAIFTALRLFILSSAS